jgi:hypothetical protein
LAPNASFDELALEISQFQARARLGESRGSARLPVLARLDDIPITPVEVFRVRPPFAFPSAQAQVCFQTSGTTSDVSGRHYMRTTETYDHLSALWGRRALLPRSGAVRVVLLMPMPTRSSASSLAHMARHFLASWDGTGELSSSAVTHDTLESRWLMGSEGVDVAGFVEQAERAARSRESLLVLATSFSLVMLLDALGGRRVPLPEGSVVMQTGGFKGRTREVKPEDLAERLLTALGPHTLVGEYGMTELSSQLYEGVLPGGELRGAPGVFLPPPWLRVHALDPVSLRRVAEGESGLAAFLDLGNVDSGVYVLTQDLVCREGAGIRLIGRRPRSPLRGCSLSAEALWNASGSDRAAVGQRESASVAVPLTRPRRVMHVGPVALRAAHGRVARLVSAARLVAAPEHALGRKARAQLEQTTGLCAAAVELGLRLSLETDPSDAEIETLCRSVPTAARVWVLLSANVFVAAHRAIACALAASETVLVRPSSRDPVLANLLQQAAPGLFRIVPELAPTLGDHVHAYGSDETLAKVRAALPDGVSLLAHGSGVGAGLVLDPGSESEAAAGFAQDAVLFEQRGCASPRVIGVGPECDAEKFCTALLEEFATWASRVPPSTRTESEAGDLRWHQSIAPHVGSWRAISGPGGAVASSVLLTEGMASWLLPPPGRNLVVFTSRTPLVSLQALASVLTSVGVTGAIQRSAEVQRVLPGVRVSEPGFMQRPPFDGPIDLRFARQQLTES